MLSVPPVMKYESPLAGSPSRRSRSRSRSRRYRRRWRCPASLGGRDAGIFGGVPDQFEQHALLRVHLRRLARRDAEKRRLEQIDVGQQAGRPRVAARRFALAGMVIESGRPAPGVNLGDRVDTGGQQLPKRLQVGAPGNRHEAPMIAIDPSLMMRRQTRFGWRGQWVTGRRRGLSFITYTPGRKNQLFEGFAAGESPICPAKDEALEL